jgi:putative hydrolase of the HAD superfamily
MKSTRTNHSSSLAPGAIALPRQQQIEAVLFDMDDTLIDWSGIELGWQELNRPLVANVYNFLEQLGHSLPDRDVFHGSFVQRVSEVWDEASENWSGPDFAEALRRVCADAGLDTTGMEMDALMRAYDWQPIPGAALYPDTLAVLQALREGGYALGLVTNSYFPMWMRDVELEHYQLLDFFDVRLTACDAGHLKPHRAIFTQALERLGAEPGRAVFVGDRPEHDIRGANDAGLISVLLDPPHLQREQNGVVPDYTIRSLSELLPILVELEKQT